MHSLRSLLLGVALVAVGTGRATAQTTYDACYVPSVGAIYLINQPGLPSACLAQGHVQFMWTSGGTLPDGSVTTAKIADGAVTAAKLSFNPATQAELNALLATLAATGTINASTNPVDWTQLKNVPAGFADGADDGAGGTSDHGALTGLTDDDHPQYLLTNGVRAAINGFAVTGTFGTGTIPTSGGAVRLMWYPGKGAFRAGAPLLGSWDDANVGIYSVALGAGTMASGAYSTAMGTGAFATGAHATAIGRLTAASGDSSTALGASTTASGAASTATGWMTTASGRWSFAAGVLTTADGSGTTALGNGTTATGSWSTAMGHLTRALGDNATAIGSGSLASGNASFAAGAGTTAGGSGTTALGNRTSATGIASTAMGTLTQASGDDATAMGNGSLASGSASIATGGSSEASGNVATAMGFHTHARAYASLAIGRYNFAGGDRTAWADADPLLVAGNGTGPSTTSNALTLLKNGTLIIAGTLFQGSDLRFKEAVAPVDGALSGVLRLQPIHFRFREGTGHPTERRIGLGAQEVERIFPELVHRDAQGYLSVAYSDLAAVLVRAMQEQQEMIRALQSEIAALRAQARQN